MDNSVIKIIEESKELETLSANFHVTWIDDTDVISRLFREIEQLPDYEAYMSNENRSFKEDKKLVLAIIKDVFANNDLLNWHLGEINVHWIGDYNEAIFSLYQSISLLSEEKELSIGGVYADDDARDFAPILFRKTLQNGETYTKMIEEKLQNWELDRINNMDMLLMQMALCELLEFPTIPIKVTLNEYIEIAKWYSSDKSKVFINGILDRLIVELRENGQLIKVGRGLYQN